MNSLPWFPMFAKDWLVSTMEMTNEEKGAYIDLLCMQWENGSVSRLPSRYAKEWATLKSKFEVNGSGQYYNPRLKEIRDEKEQLLEKQRLGGIKGARLRYRSPSGSPNKTPSGYSESESESESDIDKESEPKKKKRREYPATFERLWKVHPKGGKDAAFRAMKKLQPDEAELDRWINILGASQKSEQWLRGVSPNLSTWVNQGYFDGEIPESKEALEEKAFQAAVDSGY